MLWLRIIDVFHHSGLSGGSKRGELVLGRGPDGDRGRAAPPLRGKTRLWPTRAGVRRPRAGPCRLGPVVAGTRMARFHRLYMLFQPGTYGLAVSARREWSQRARDEAARGPAPTKTALLRSKPAGIGGDSELLRKLLLERLRRVSSWHAASISDTAWDVPRSM
jgi:hypothetical protein